MQRSDTWRRAFLPACACVWLLMPCWAMAGEDVCSGAAPPAPGITNVLSSVALGQQASQRQLAGHWYWPEEGRWRWMGKAAAVYLRVPAGKQATLQMEFSVSKQHLDAVGTVVLTVNLGGKLLDRQKYSEAGFYTYRAVIPREQLPGEIVCAGLSVDKTFQAPGDQRTLGLALSRLGFLEGGEPGK